ncbi:hypothetical protein ABZW11_13095 [Nonomuraea sp. NPDC004580]|uniref:hypothetical protein n=1 Tax=Nonomuraea sp. NPDC004580 TaxID=3154552 RepID=UPI0033ABEDD4
MRAASADRVAARMRAAVSDQVASGPAIAAPRAKPVIFRLAPVVKIWLRSRSGASRWRIANRAVSWGPGRCRPAAWRRRARPRDRRRPGPRRPVEQRPEQRAADRRCRRDPREQRRGIGGRAGDGESAFCASTPARCA